MTSESSANETRRGETFPAVVVTGASEGIGLALAHRFAKGTGHAVVLIARNAAALEKAASDITAVHGVKTIPLPLDLVQPDAPDIIERKLAGSGLHAEILINNAGIGLGGEFVGHDEAAIAGLLDLNVRSLALLTRRFLPPMLARRHGSIINLASLGGFTPGPYQATYYASKAFVLSFTRAVAQETSGGGVRVCVVAPGPVDTAFHAKMGAETALYRFMMPALSAEAVARSTWRGWRLGFRVIQPGLFNPLTSVIMRWTPWLLLAPIVGWLLQKRYGGTPGTSED